jgi:uncharacterized membrane protein YkvA (DUF1232 family)
VALRLKERLAVFLNKHPLLLVVFVVLYVISPIDALPEALTGFAGFIDDILLILVSIYLRRLGGKKHIDITAE